MHELIADGTLPRHVDLNDQIANESIPWLNWRHTLQELTDLLEDYVPFGKRIFTKKETPLHEDFFRTVQPIQLTKNYTVEYTGHGREKLDAATIIHVVTGTIEVSTTDANGLANTQKITAGNSIFLTDTNTQRISAPNGAQVLQAVSPSHAFGRTFLLPKKPPTEPISERISPKTDRLLATLRATARIREKALAHASSTVANVFQSRNASPYARPPRLLEVHAHPDDEASKGAATKAKYLAMGYQIRVAILTGGEQGTILNPALEDHPLANDSTPESHTTMRELRQKEAEAASAAQGYELELHHFDDSGMPENNVPIDGALSNPKEIEKAINLLAVSIRTYRPDVITGYGPDNDNKLAKHGAYTHLDHDAVHRIVGAAIVRAADDKAPLDTELPPWLVKKHYYHVPFEKRHARWIHRARKLNKASSPYDNLFAKPFRRSKSLRGEKLLKSFSRRPLTRVNCGRYLHHAQRAAEAYKSQIGDVLWQWLPQERFRLAGSLVPTPLREYSLFAGIHRANKTPQTTSLYANLGLAPGAPINEIEKAWRQRSRLLRPAQLPGETTPVTRISQRLRRALPAALTGAGRQRAQLLRAQRSWEILGSQHLEPTTHPPVPTSPQGLSRFAS